MPHPKDFNLVKSFVFRLDVRYSTVHTLGDLDM